MEKNYILELTVVLKGITKHIISILTEGLHSEAATINALLKKATELYIEAMDLSEPPTKEEVKELHKSVVKNYKSQINYYPPEKEELLQDEYIIKVEPVKAKVKKTYTVNIFSTVKGASFEMKKYNTKIEEFKSLALYIRKDERGCYVVTEALSGLRIAEAITKKGIEAQLKSYIPRKLEIKTRLQEVYTKNGNLNPHIVSEDYYKNTIQDKNFEDNRKNIKDPYIKAIKNNLENANRILRKYESKYQGLENRIGARYSMEYNKFKEISNWTDKEYKEQKIDTLVGLINDMRTFSDNCLKTVNEMCKIISNI